MSAPVSISFGEEKKVERVYNLNHGKLLDLTPEAIAKVKDFTTRNPAAAGKNFRIFVESGGCSGMQYGFTFDHRKDDDNIVPCEDIAVLINNASLVYIKGAVVDYVDNSSGSGFIIKNPQSKGECGCGVSFTV